MGKKTRKQRREKLSFLMGNREIRRHPEHVEQIRLGRSNVNNIMFRAYLTNGTRKSC